jgi:MFS family permease
MYSKRPSHEIALLALSYPLGMYLAARLWKPTSKDPRRWHFGEVCSLILVSGALSISTTLTQQPVWVTMLILFVFGGSIGLFTVQARSVRSIVIPSALQGEMIASQTLAGRLCAPLAGLLFGPIVARPDLLNLTLACTLVLTVLASVLVFQQVRHLNQAWQSQGVDDVH